jgi:hypothetical protein
LVWRLEVLLGLIDAHRVAVRTTKDLGGHGLPGLAARAVQQCAEALEDPVWLGCAAVVRGYEQAGLLLAAQAASTLGGHGTSATHLVEASALAARMDTEVGAWANLVFGPTNVGEWRAHIALGLGEYAQAVQVAKAVHPELLPKRSQAFFWSEVGRALVAREADPGQRHSRAAARGATGPADDPPRPVRPRDGCGPAALGPARCRWP